MWFTLHIAAVFHLCLLEDSLTLLSRLRQWIMVALSHKLDILSNLSFVGLFQGANIHPKYDMLSGGLNHPSAAFLKIWQLTWSKALAVSTNIDAEILAI